VVLESLRLHDAAATDAVKHLEHKPRLADDKAAPAILMGPGELQARMTGARASIDPIDGSEPRKDRPDDVANGQVQLA
jgi:hypothetical protein